MRDEIADLFEFDRSLTHLNHGAFGAVPRVVREAQDRHRARVEAAPMRHFRDQILDELAASRRAAADFVGVPEDSCALVRNVTEGVCAVLDSMRIGPGDDVVVNDHCYGSVAMAVEARGARVVRSSVPIEQDSQTLVAAMAAAVTSATRLVIIDHISSPTALLMPVAELAAAVAPVPVLVDAAHVPGALASADVEALGVAYWVGNLHKWALVPRSSALLWAAPQYRDHLRPVVTGWSHGLSFPQSFDLLGTVDHSAWLAIPEGLAFWRDLGGWSAVDRAAELVESGSKHLATVLGTSTEVSGIPSGPVMRIVRLPDGVGDTYERSEALWQRLYAAGFLVAPVAFAGRGYLRLGAHAYNDEDDIIRLADALPKILRQA